MGHAVPPGSILRTLSSPGEERESGGIREPGWPPWCPGIISEITSGAGKEN